MDIIEKTLRESVYFVEANDFEYYALWKLWHEKTEWVEDHEGFGYEIGKCDNRSVWMSFRFAFIHGKRVCFYNPTSQVVDWVLVEKYIKDNFISDENGVGMADAQNFHNVIIDCKS